MEIIAEEIFMLLGGSKKNPAAPPAIIIKRKRPIKMGILLFGLRTGSGVTDGIGLD